MPGGPASGGAGSIQRPVPNAGGSGARGALKALNGARSITLARVGSLGLSHLPYAVRVFGFLAGSRATHLANYCCWYY
jgi:hypothetical protein